MKKIILFCLTITLLISANIYASDLTGYDKIGIGMSSPAGQLENPDRTALYNIVFSFLWGDLIEQLGLSTERARELEKIFSDPAIKDPQAKLREELGEAGYQAYLDYLPTIPLRNELVPFEVELAKRGTPMDRETEKMLLQIIREEKKPIKPGEDYDAGRTQKQLRERIYQRASGVLSPEARALFKPQQENKF
jgi:hypothetical protein